jgi:hypothetical protein
MSEFKLASGVSVPSLEGIHECYEVRNKGRYSSFAINLSLDTLEILLKRFCMDLVEPCFFVIEIPTNLDIEKKIRTKEPALFHSDVFYYDNCSRNTLLKIMDTYGEVLLNDGMSSFGFASHVNKDEIFVGKYKVTNIFTAEPLRYHQMLKEQNIPEENEIKTVWNNFSEDAPGEAQSLELDGKTVYDVVEKLTKQGMYFAERREQ